MNSISRNLAGLALIAWSVCASAQIYTVTSIGNLPWTGGPAPGQPPTHVSGVNDLGQVTGYSYIGPKPYVELAFLYSNGVMQDLGTLPDFMSNSEGVAINASGQVTGVSSGISGAHAFLYSNGVMTDIGTLGGTHSQGSGINASGQVTGASNPPGNGDHAFIYSDGVMQDLGTLGGVSSYGTGINVTGEVAGYSWVTGNGAQHAFLYSGGVMQDLGTLGGANSYAWGINDSGEVAGDSYLSDNVTLDVFLYSNGVMQDLGSLGAPNGPPPVAINASGQIVTWGYANGTTYAALYTNGQWFDLNKLINPNSGFSGRLQSAFGISDSGNIIAFGYSRTDSNAHAFLLTPGAPLVTPIIKGTFGQNGWYVSKPTSLRWKVGELPVPPATSGCGNVTVPDTKGTTYTCSATNQYGAASDSLTIKKDTVAPKVTIKSPSNGAAYSLNSVVTASYKCTDATSGVAKCNGLVANGNAIPTSTPGSFTFTVTAADTAGNTSSASVSYLVQ